MTTTVVYAGTADGLLEVSSNTYATARSGGGSFTVDTSSTGTDTCGQAFFSPTYYLMESFYPFDTSGIPDTDTVSAAVFSIYGKSNKTTTDFTVDLAAFDFGTLTSADWQDGTELAALTVLATFATSGFSTAAYNDFTDSGGMAASVNKTGTTRYVIYSARQAAGTTPTGEEWFEAWFADNTGTTNDPKLTITHASSAVTGDGAVSVAPSASATGTPVVTGSAAASIAPAASASGTPVVTGTGAPQVAPSASGTGTTVITATGAVSVAPSVSASGTGVVTGAGAATVAPSASASGAPVVTGTGAATVQPAVAGQGAELEPVTGTGAVSVAPSVSASGSPLVVGTGAVTVAAVVAASGSGIVTGTGAVAIPAAMVAALGTQVITGTGAASVQPSVAGMGAIFDWAHARGTVTLSSQARGTVAVSAPATGTVTTDSQEHGVVTT